MGIFLSILKIIGIILLYILAFVLILVLIILICPIHYEGRAAFNETANVHVKVGWLLIIRVFVDVVENKPDFVVKLFGLRVFPRKKKKGKEKEKDTEKEPAPHILTDEKEEKDDEKPKEETAEEKTDAVTCAEKTEDEEVTEEAEKIPLPEKLENLLERGIYIWDNTTCVIADESSSLFRFFSRKSTKNSIVWTKDFLLKVLNHIRPKKLEGNLEFGMDDPAMTGYIFAGLAQFYDFYYKKFGLMPNFEGQTIKGELEFNGRIVLGYLVVKAGRLYLRKQFRQFIKNAKGLKNETMKNIEKIKDGITNYG